MNNKQQNNYIVLFWILSFTLLPFGKMNAQEATSKFADMPSVRAKLNGGLSFEIIGISAFLQIGFHDRVSVGVRLGVSGPSLTEGWDEPGYLSYLAVAGRHFATQSSLAYQEREEDENEEYTEFAWIETYLELRRPRIDYNFGFRLAGFNHTAEGEFTSLGGFTGLFFQPAYKIGPENRLNIGARIAIGSLVGSPQDRDIGVVIHPLVVTLKIGKS